MAEAAVLRGVTRVGVCLVPEVKFMCGVSNQVELLKTVLNLMQGLLKDADVRQDESETLRWCVAEIRDLLCDAEVVIERYSFKVASRRGGGVQKVMKRYTCILGEAITIYKVGSDVVKIMKKLSHLETTFYNTRGVGDMQPQQRKTTHPEHEHDVVELEDDVDKLVKFLLNENNRTAFICGMAGIGKTSLARMVYNHPTVAEKFPRRAWISLSQQIKPRTVWEEIWFSLCPTTSPEQRNDVLQWPDSVLTLRLCEVQRGNECLVILDNIWTSKDWESLVNAFPWRERKILLTSRNKDLPSKVDANCLVHELQRLDDRKSWQLFKKILMAQRQGSIISNEMENLGKEMVKDCGGIPLAIFVLQRILATKTLEEWREQVGRVPIKDDLQMIEVLALSYYDLPYCLKQCFLYLGHFPKGFEIPAKELIRMWMAEGFIPDIHHEREWENTMEMMGEIFLKELVQRCMVQIEKTDSLGRIKTCRIHDFMLFFCVLRAREENFLQIMNIPCLIERRETVVKVRRIAINEEQHNSDPSLLLMISKDYPHLRSLLYFRPDNLNSFYLVKSMYKNFKSLRVLNLKNFGFYKRELPKDIGCLIHLRFLSLEKSNIYNVPSSIGNLRCLQTLDLRSHTDGSRMPNVFKKMQKLRHLYLPINYRVSEKLELANLPNLQTLVNVDLNKCNLTPTFPSLRVLVIGTESCNEETTDIVSMVSSCPHLYRLNLRSKIQQLPGDDKICQHIAKLTLKFTFLQEDPMPILGKLRKLKILRLLLNAFEGKQMTCNRNGFPHLRFLVLSGLTNLEKWVVEEEAMKILFHLEIACQALMMIPDGLRSVTTLQELDISTMPESFKDRLRGTQFHKFAHVRSSKLKEE